MTTITELDKALMGQYTIDSMSKIKPAPGLKADDEMSILQFQVQAPQWCHHSKPIFMSELLQGMPGVSPQQVYVMAYFKKRMSEFANNPKYKADSWMKWLYSSPDRTIIITQIAHLAQAALFKEAKNVAEATKEQRLNSLNPESVSLPIALYTYFTILVNPSFLPDDYDYLFQHSWYQYYSGWRSFYVLLSMNGDSWKDDMKNVLIV